jgi:hypothetical protein
MIRRSVSDTEIHMLAGADTPAPTACHGCSPVRATATFLASIREGELPSGLYKNNGKPTIDGNVFQSTAKAIKANLASKADAVSLMKRPSSPNYDIVLVALSTPRRRSIIHRLAHAHHLSTKRIINSSIGQSQEHAWRILLFEALTLALADLVFP